MKGQVFYRFNHDLYDEYTQYRRKTEPTYHPHGDPLRYVYDTDGYSKGLTCFEIIETIETGNNVIVTKVRSLGNEYRVCVPIEELNKYFLVHEVNMGDEHLLFTPAPRRVLPEELFKFITESDECRDLRKEALRRILSRDTTNGDSNEQ